MYGWTGKIAWIDLTRQKTNTLSLSPDTYARFLGGKGMGGFFLRPCAELAWDHPDMPVCLFTGPLTATIAPTSGRSHMVSLSPLTGLVADASMGGKIGVQLKRAGWDGLVITGKSKCPVGIEIQDSRITLMPAAHLWGLPTNMVHDALSPGRAGLACIGPAGENGVRFAAVIVDRYHAAGRTGLGLNLGTKKIKYIRVSGTGSTRVKDPDRLKQARADIFRLTAASPALMGRFGFSCMGTGAMYDLMDNRCMMPTDNFAATRFAFAGQLNAHAYAKTYAPKKHGCKGCHILCKKIAGQPSSGPAMPEFETMSHFTALVGCRDKELVMRANQLCNNLGMDTISAASVLACFREITGTNFTPRSLLNMLEEIALDRGDGKALKNGAAAWAQSMGTPGAAMAVKGLDLPAYDPRGAYGMALGFAMSTRGGCHLRAYPIAHEILRKPVATDRFSFSGKARIIKIAEDLNAVVDSLTACKFTFFAAGLEEYARAISAVTGKDFTAQDLLATGEKIVYNERIINSLNKFDARHDDLPERFFKQPGTGCDQFSVPPIDRTAFLAARQAYYAVRELTQTGLPVREKAEKLGLEWHG
ncbi:MAG: aldehyde ferredoxin oxidoreductase [Desulfotignum sp.]|nr:aldehyde ferredoxin oxidoreductase [Desulfotignum sp.]MCF8113194.1 aldehyde ferredoxin oxidoreductase [Desulfotignum sp.]MCF8125649.1 aldehyde ferredoxin oxidoreductase [Desulfotignum sp.]